jgi:hypothetical protein
MANRLKDVSESSDRDRLGRLRVSRPQKRFRSVLSWAWKIAAGVAFSGLLALVLMELWMPLIGCGIKGNVSVGSGERIYHMRGQKLYWETRINLFRGERFFCSEQAARQAGWRKSRI